MTDKTSSYIKLMYPNETYLTIEGHPEIIRQILDTLNGVLISYTSVTALPATSAP